MTTRRHLFRVKRPRTVTTYGVHQLDNTRQEYALERWQVHREALQDDPWLSPEKSEVVQALLILIASAARQTSSVPGRDWDLHGFCCDAELTERQTEVVVLTGEGWSQRQIGDWLEISQPTVCQHLATARHRLVGRLPLVVEMALTRSNPIA